MSNSTVYKQGLITTTRRDEIISCWKSLFPMKSRQYNFEDFLEKISGKKLDFFLENYDSNEVSEEIEQVFSHMEENRHLELLEEILSSQAKKNMWAFFFKPVLLLYMDNITELAGLDIIEDKDSFLDSVIDSIIEKLTVLSYRTIIVETNIARLDQRLEGETSEERGKYYTQHLLRDMNYLKEIYLVYPELYEAMKRTALYITMYYREIILNTKENLKELEKIFNGGNSLGRLKNIKLGNGDTHNNGKTVATLSFVSKMLIYKPRSFTMEKAYEEFLSWVNGRIPGFSPLSACKTYGMGDAGWMEFIQHSECKTMEEVEEFYLKMGELLCLFYTLNSKDCHCENIIACGKQPILIDLETVLHTDEYDKHQEFASIEEYIGNYIQNSVDSVMILPSLLQNFNNGEVMEIGAIGSGKPKKSPFKTQKIKNFDSDDITVEEEYKDIADSANYPLYKGEKIGGNGYIGFVRQGFVNTYEWILENKAEYTAKIKDLFGKVECRVIYKATNDYNQLIATSYHPDLLHNRMDRLVYFHRIGILIPDIENFHEQKLYRTEIEAMLNGDVPSFKITADSLRATNHKNEVVYDKYKKSIIETLEDKINRLSKIDLERQVALIYMSYMGCKMETDLPRGTKTLFSKSGNSGDNYDYLKLADSIGEKIIKRGFSTWVNGKREHSWICYAGFGDDYYSINPVGWDLYKGNCGIAVYFMYLGKTLKEESYIQYAKDTLNSVDRMINLNNCRDIETMGYGVFTGIFSYAYALYRFLRAGVFGKEEAEAAWERIYRIIRYTNEKIQEQEKVEVLGGVCGIAGVLASIYPSVSQTQQGTVKELISKIIARLKKAAVYISPEEITWTQNGDIGYAHGNAGIMCHLARCYEIIPDREILSLIEKCLNYERNIRFDKSAKRWLVREKTHYFSWCNGIAGLLLSKLLLYQSPARDEKLLEEINRLMEQLKLYGFGTDYSICHGDMGSICILRYAAELTGQSRLLKQCTYALDNYIRNQMLAQADSMYTIEDWGLMVGKAGIGMGLLDVFNQNNLTAELLSLR
ncbi:lanthionine synthetase C-like protein [Ruminiclostridium hungatei]|uniref:Lanthionine synthetase C-like protein n=1 Tax=Ruminiclostridium hungatei TaxID=48256 RepID=A0A1V4SNY0_RUMHU|nr:type 2 lanthipeptide synthetase LanM [Ruminiclostridium hungatei]OPX45176.1 lanthionine synthetase C-like protein [Ruminiclostridium hungatei]